jgi:PAS domain S-box-containing protein
VFVANSQGKYLFANNGASQLLGYSKKELLKMSIPQVLPDDYLEAGLEEFKKVKETGKSRNELCLKKKNGSAVAVILTATQLPDGNLIANCEDVTERKELEKQLRIKERLAAIGTTAGMVGHDIRNPLQAMISDTYLLKDELISMPECKMKEGVVESIDNIEKNIGYINKIVADLQDYARTSEPNYIDVNLYELVTSLLQPIDIPDNVNCSIEIEHYLHLKTDPELITRALTNMIINALQAMPDGGNLNLRVYLDKDKANLIVEDTGVGIPEEVKPKLFTPMVTTKAKGQGLGLAVVKRLVEALKGTISFESQVGKGTKFTIQLPIVQ